MLHCRTAVHIVVPHIPFPRVQGVASYSSDIWSEFQFHTSQNIAGKPSRSPIRRQLEKITTQYTLFVNKCYLANAMKLFPHPATQSYRILQIAGIRIIVFLVGEN